MSRRSIHADDDEDLQHPLLPTDRGGGMDSSTPLLRQGTLPHAANTAPNSAPSSSHLMATKSPIHLDFDSNDDDSSSIDSFYSSGGSKSAGGGRLRHVDPNLRVGVNNAAPGHLRPASMDDLGGDASISGGALPPLMLREQPPSHAPTPLPALMSQDASGRRGIANLRPKRIKRISNYVLGPLMGEGTLGHVRDALDCSKQVVERVAVKTIRRKHRSEAELRRVAAILENEVEHLQRYHHPNIIRAVDIFHRDGKDYIVLPIATCSLEQLVQFRRKEINKRRYTLFSDRASSISGISLLGGGGGVSSTRFSNQQHLAVPATPPQGSLSQFNFSPRALFPVQLVKDIFFQFLSGLAYMHKQGVSHNDLKPANILLFGDGVVKLADLGTCATTFKGRGTPAFVSPQVASASGDPIDGRKNDMWACGVILFYLLTNMMPFHRENEYALYETIARGEVNFDLVPSEEALEAAQPSAATLPSPSNNNNNSIRSTSSSGSKDPKTGANGSAGSFTAAGGSFGGGATAHTAKHLLRQLLEKHQDKRITAADALQHQWLSTCGANNTTTDVPAGTNNKRRTQEQSPSPERGGSGQHGADRAGYLKKVVCNVRELAAVMERDAGSHLQFVCEAASTAGIAVPSIVFRSSDAETDSDDDGRALLASNITEPTRVSGAPNATGTAPRQRNDTVATTTAKKIGPSANHSKNNSGKDGDAVPRGTVFRNRFLGVEELAHYGRKGHPECDVRSLRLDAQKRSLIHDYLQHTIAARGYYGRRKQMEALGVPVDDADDAATKQRCCCVIC